jgi:threonine dehydrogenase-like Zn-dependent dehydrogenase
MVLAMARIMGGIDIVVADIDPHARKFSIERGAVDAIDPRDEIKAEQQKMHGFDVVFEASGSPQALSFGYTAAARGARIVQIGTQPSETSLNNNLVMSKELTVFGSFRYAHVFPTVVELMASGRIDTDDLISVVYPFEKLQEAVDRASAKQGIVKVQVGREGGR